MTAQQELFTGEAGRSLVDELLETPAESEDFVPLAKRLAEFAKKGIEASETLSRYREVRKRMGEPERAVFSEPNFPVVVHSV
ncbi:MAG: hypothetical protein FJ387_24285 [Verrucomicrobia bacterium]|nr:hypothetical protein [Verrucomicrobiota bacterium]